MATREAEGTYSETDKSQLSGFALSDLIQERRSQTTIRRNMDNDDFAWASEHAGD